MVAAHFTISALPATAAALAPNTAPATRPPSAALRPLLVGSGLDASNGANFLAHADGAIVVASLKRDEVITNPVDLERVREMAGRLGEVG